MKTKISKLKRTEMSQPRRDRLDETRNTQFRQSDNVGDKTGRERDYSVTQRTGLDICD